MKNSDSISVTLNNSQAMVQIINANTTYCAWQRGSGKTGGGIGPRLMHLNNVMPKSQILLFSDTYDRLKKRIVPGIMNFWKYKFGWVEGQDFVLYKRPPSFFQKPWIEPGEYEHIISTSEGMCICLVSLNVEGSANAYNAQSAIGDEVKFCDEEQINSEVLPALRGEESRYGHLPEYLSVWMFTDKFHPKIKWYLRKKELMNEKAVQAVYSMQMQIIEWQKQLATIDDTNNYRYEIKKKINEYQTKADRLRKYMVYYSDMKPYENLPVVGEFFFKRAKKICKSEYQFNVSFLNHDPDRVEHTFYPDLTDNHFYDCNGFDDVDMFAPLIISTDFNWRIVCMCIAQIGKLPEATEETLNILASVHALHPGGIDEAVRKFCNLFKSHSTHTVYYIYDSTTIAKDAGRDAYMELVCKQLRLNGWKYVKCYIGQLSDHSVRFFNIKKHLTNTGRLAIRFNSERTLPLRTSLQNAGAITSAGKTKKDKRPETDNSTPAEDATHHSEAFDQLCEGVIERKAIKSISGTPAVLGGRK